MAKEDGRKNNGGKREGAGRPKKADEIKKIEMMDSVCPPLEAWEALHKKIKSGDTKAIQFWIEHRFGKAPNKVDVTTDGEQMNNPLIMFGKE
jgi:hypothetical protein